MSIIDFGQGAVEIGLQGLWNEKASNSARDFALMAQDRQYERDRDDWMNRYYRTTADMRRAGLNPILAATGGIQVGATPSVDLPSVPQTAPVSMPDLDFGSTAKKIAEAKKAEAEAGKAKEETVLAKNRAMSELASMAKMRAETKKATTEERLSFQKIYNAEKEFEVLNKQLDQIQSQTAVNEAERSKIAQMTENLFTIGKQLKMELEKLGRTANVYSGPAGQVISYVKEIMGSLPVSGSATKLIK